MLWTGFGSCRRQCNNRDVVSVERSRMEANEESGGRWGDIRLAFHLR